MRLDFSTWVPGAFLGQSPRMFVQQRELTCSGASTPPGPPQVGCPATDASHMTSPLLPGRLLSLPKEGEVTAGHGLQQRGHSARSHCSEPHALCSQG